MELGTMRLAAIAGCLGTVGSVFGKLASAVSTLSWIKLSLKLLLYIIMIIVNSISSILFVNSLTNSMSSTPPTVISSTINYITSALAGIILFGETISLMWWCGTSMVLLGLLLICVSSTNKQLSHMTIKIKTDK